MLKIIDRTMKKKKKSLGDPHIENHWSISFIDQNDICLYNRIIR